MKSIQLQRTLKICYCYLYIQVYGVTVITAVLTVIIISYRYFNKEKLLVPCYSTVEFKPSKHPLKNYEWDLTTW